MKKFVNLIIILLVFSIFPQTASAFFTPLVAPYWAASVNEESPIELVSYNALLDIQKDVVNIKIKSVIKNSSNENADILIGIPQQFNNGKTQISNPEVYVNGIKQNLSSRNNETNPDTTGLKELPSKWLAWDMKFAPNGSKVVEIAFSIETDFNSGVSDIVLPLSYLNPFKGPAANINVTAGTDFFPELVLEANPTIVPDSVNIKGEMEWVFNNIDTIPDIKLKANDLASVIESALMENAEDTNKANTIMDYYKKMEYDSAISSIKDYFRDHSNTKIKSELNLLLGMSYKAISNFAGAKSVYTSLSQSDSSLKMPSVLKNSILFETYLMNSSGFTEKELNEYLLQYKPYIEGNDTMAMYLQSLLQNIPEPEPEEEETEKDPEPATKETPSPDDKDQLVKFIVIGGVKIPVEFIFLGAFVIIVLIILYARRRRRRRRSAYLLRF